MTIDCRWGISLLVIGLLMGAPAANAGEPAGSLVVIGATAKSSLEIIRQGLEAGYEITAVARDPAALALKDPHLKIVQGDVYERSSLQAVMTGKETVISMVGPRVDPFKEVEKMDLFSTGTTNIIDAMRKKGNRRLLIASSIGVENQFPTEKPDNMKEPGKMWLWNSRRLYEDMRVMEDIVRKSGLDYVIFRPGFMVQEPARHDLVLAVDQDSPKQRMITYADFGGFVVAQVRSDKYLGRTVGVSSDRELQFGKNANFEEMAREALERARKEKPREDK